MDVQELLATRREWYAWVIEYGITHSVMRIAIHEGDFPNHHELICGDVRTFRGAMQGGPYRLRLTTGDNGLLELIDQAGAFELRCGRIAIGRSRP